MKTDPVPYDELQRYTDFPLGDLISHKEYEQVVSHGDAARYRRFMEVVIAGGNRYTLMALRHIDATPEAMMEADFIEEIKDFLPKLEKYRKMNHLLMAGFFVH